MVGTARLDMSKCFSRLDMTTGIESLQYMIHHQWSLLLKFLIPFCSTVTMGHHHKDTVLKGSNSDVAFDSQSTYIRVPSLLFAGSLRGTESIGKSPSSGACRSSVRCQQGRGVPAVNCSHRSRNSLELKMVCS